MAASSSHLVHHLFRAPPPSPPSSTLLSLFLKRTVFLPSQTPIRDTSFSPLSTATSSLSLSNSVSPSPPPLSPLPLTASLQSLKTQPAEEPDLEDEDNYSEAIVEEEKKKWEKLEPEVKRNELEMAKVPSLSVKEKKELASYAHSLGKKLKCQLVGKSGVTAAVASSFSETLEANELLKIKFHGTCPGELPDMVKHLEEATGSVVVGQIGRTVIIYRPSITKMKAEEKRQQHRRMFVRRSSTPKPTLEKRGPVQRLYRQNRRGSSKV